MRECAELDKVVKEHRNGWDSFLFTVGKNKTEISLKDAERKENQQKTSQKITKFTKTDFEQEVTEILR